jgi:hypothetical protein
MGGKEERIGYAEKCALERRRISFPLSTDESPSRTFARRALAEASYLRGGRVRCERKLTVPLRHPAGRKGFAAQARHVQSVFGIAYRTRLTLRVPSSRTEKCVWWYPVGERSPAGRRPESSVNRVPPRQVSCAERLEMSQIARLYLRNKSDGPPHPGNSRLPQRQGDTLDVSREYGGRMERLADLQRP